MLKGVLAAVGAVGIGTLAWASLVERNRFVLREQVAAVLPPGHRPIRVLHLSDLHMAPWQHRKQEWIASLARLQPDLVVSTGDLLGHAHGFGGVAVALEPFRGVPGVFVNGSNDYFGPQLKNPFRYLAGPSREPKSPQRLDTEQLTNWLTEMGWHDLNNRVAELRVRDTEIGFAGVDDPHLGLDNLALLDDRSALPAAADARIGVTHAPYRRVLDAMTEQGADVVFAGHTHGGQVCLPAGLGGALVTNCDLPREYASGMHEWHTATRASVLNVSAGIGTSIFAPVRLFCRPEASLVTLIARDA